MSSLMSSLRGAAGTAGEAVDVSNIRKEGWVMKESAMIRSYRKRWQGYLVSGPRLRKMPLSGTV